MILFCRMFSLWKGKEKQQYSHQSASRKIRSLGCPHYNLIPLRSRIGNLRAKRWDQWYYNRHQGNGDRGEMFALFKIDNNNDLTSWSFNITNKSVGEELWRGVIGIIYKTDERYSSALCLRRKKQTSAGCLFLTAHLSSQAVVSLISLDQSLRRTPYFF